MREHVLLDLFLSQDYILKSYYISFRVLRLVRDIYFSSCFHVFTHEEIHVRMFTHVQILKCLSIL